MFAGVGRGSLAPEFMKILVAAWRVPDEVECSGPPAASMAAAWLEFVIELVARGSCAAWGGMTLYSCSCNAALTSALLPELVVVLRAAVYADRLLRSG